MVLHRVRQQITTPRDARLLVRMLAWACGLRALKHAMPLPALVRLVRLNARAQTSRYTEDDRRRDRERIVTLAGWSCRLTRWSSGGNCLERGLVQYRFLAAAGFEPSLYVGFGRGGRGELRGHAWVVLDGRPVGESEASLADFELAVAFGPDGTVGGWALTGSGF